MPKRLVSLTAAALAIGLCLPAAAQDTPSAETVVAKVNGVEITLGHMIMVRAGLPDQYQQLPDDVLWDGIMDQLIQQTVLAESSGAENAARVRMALENERRTLLAAEAMQDITEEAVTDEAIEAMYNERFVQEDQGVEFDASHILVETEESAKQLVEDLNGGADFAELAKEHSTGPSGPNGGNLGWFGEGQMVPEFEAGVKTLEPGQVSAPVQTQFGWHVIKLNGKRAKEAPALDSVRAQLTQELQQQAVQERIDMLVGQSDVTRTEKDDIDTSVLQDLDLLER